MKIAQMRLSNQGITSRRAGSPAEVVRLLGAVQAQDYNHGLWAVGLRTPEPAAAAVEQALRDGTIMRTWPMRGTLHFIPPEDAGWMLKLLATRVVAKLTPKAWAYHALETKDMAVAEKAVIKALRGGKIIPRAAMIDVLKAAGIPNDRQQSYFIFVYLCQTGVMCLGPPNDGSPRKEQTFALLDEWAPHQRSLDYEESIVELARRFFASHGPATLADFAYWSGLRMPEAQLGLDAVQSGLARETFGGKDYWLPPDSRPGSGTHLLPAYDELLIGYKDRGPSYETYGPVPISTHNGMFFSTAVEDGQVIGVWKRTLGKTRVTIEVSPVAPVDADQVLAHAEIYGRFVGLPPKLVIKEVTKAGPMHRGFGRPAQLES
jgi:hypothetical protein